MEVLDRQEVGTPMRLLEVVANLKHHTILTTTYAAGLRVSEHTHRRVTDIDSQCMVLRIDQGKDRYVMLSPRLLEALRAYWRSERPRMWLFPGELPEQPITTGERLVASGRTLAIATNKRPHPTRLILDLG